MPKSPWIIQNKQYILAIWRAIFIFRHRRLAVPTSWSRLHAVRFSLTEQASRLHGVYFSGLRPRHCPDIFRTFPTTTIRFERSADASGPPHREIHYIRALPRASAAQRPQPPHVLKLCQMGSLAIQHPETAPALCGQMQPLARKSRFCRKYK
jgi:hypothetical protein